MKKSMDLNKIDVVITWVDGNDKAWQAEKEKYLPLRSDKVRYRNWDNVQYIFRGIEKFMPWVNCVHFVTWGHLPKWMNTNYEKLHVVNHKDFIPKEYLPTFNSNAIELNLHRIPGLSENFINFNDDMFVIAPTKPNDFFENGLSPVKREIIANIEMNNIGIINDHFNVKDIYKYRKKWFNFRYGKYIVRTLIFSKFNTILGIFEPHIPFSYKKSTFAKVWEVEHEALDATCRNKTRAKNDVNQWLFRQWQIMTGDFEPRRWDFGLLTSAGPDDEKIINILRKPGKIKMLCINDTTKVSDFEKSKHAINTALEQLLPEKSKFEN